MTSHGRLADYLRVRRAQLSPEDVGLAVGPGVRRVSGLRRDEVAILAGVSTDYYLRLEQGRDRNPSPQVLEALARALRLEPLASAYLHSLARPPVDTGALAVGDIVSHATRLLIDSWPLTSAVVHNRYLEVLASNRLARALNPNYRPGVNSVISLFADPAERTLHVEWEALAARSVALLRILADTRSADARLDALVAEGASSSALFREFWGRQDVFVAGDGVHVLQHPHVGELTLRFVRLSLVGTDGHSIFAYVAEPGTASAEALQKLADSA